MQQPTIVLSTVGRMALTFGTSTALLMGTAVTSAATHSGADRVDELAVLIAQVGEADQELADLGAEIQRRQEDVNRALIEISARREAAAQAAAEAAASRRDQAAASTNIAVAQDRFDSYAASAYINGPSSSLIEASNPVDVIAAASSNQSLANAFKQVQINLQRARTDQANKQSAALAAQHREESAAQEAQRGFDDAVETLTDTQRGFAEQQEHINQLVAKRNAAQQQLQLTRHTRSDEVTTTGSPESPTASAPNWDLATRKPGGWDTLVPAIPSANIAGDPVAIINAVLRISASSAQVTADLGRKFLSQLGILPAAAAPTDPGITNGRIPYVNGRQASEYVIRRAMAQIGVPYSWGGGTASGPSRGIDSGSGTIGFDCSGLMLYAFAGVGIKLPHYSGSQYTSGRQIPSAQMRRGDLLFWGPNASQHEAMYLGDGQMLEAQQTGVPVKISPVRTSGMTPFVTRLIEY